MRTYGGLIGETAAVGLLRFLYSNDAPFKPKDILTDYKSNRATVKKLLKAGKIDSIRSTHKNLMNHLRAQRNADTVIKSNEKIKSLILWLKDIPADLTTEFVNFLIECEYNDLKQLLKVAN